MPTIEKPDCSRWFQSEPHLEQEQELIGWDSRHVALVDAYLKEWIIPKRREGLEWWPREPDAICFTLFGDEPKRSSDNRTTEAELVRVEFEALAKKWQRETVHLSLISKKITHPAYFRIVGMGKAVVPLLLEALRDKPAHWFAALRATANIDPSPADANSSMAREAWLMWGRSEGLID